MSPSYKLIPLGLPLAATLALVLAGCGGDGKNASDNPISAPQIIPSSGTGGTGGSGTALPEAGSPLAISTDISGSVLTARAVVDGSGNIMAIWTQSDGSHINLWTSRYTVGIGWSAAQKLESGTLDVKSFQIVQDAAGNVTVVWTQASADSYMSGSTQVNVERTDLWARQYTASSVSWGAVQLVENNDLSAIATQNIEDIDEFQLITDNTGIVSVVWTQYSGSRYDLYANRATAGTWGAAILLDSDIGDVTSPQLLADSSGNLFALWVQSDGTRLNLWGSHYSSGWASATKIDTEDLGDVEAPKAVVDGNGNATVVWRQYDGIFWNLWRVRYAAGWGAAAKAENSDNDVSAPQLSLYAGNNVMLLWVQNNGTVNNVWASNYVSSWSANSTITDGSGDAGSATMTADSSGNVTTVWVQHDATAVTPVDNLWANRFSGGSWGTPTTIETNNDGDARSPMLLVDSGNRVTALWLQNSNGRLDLWSNRNTSGIWGSASSVEGVTDGSAVDPHAVVSSSGNVTVVWRQPYDTSTYLVTNTYIVGAASGWGSVAKVDGANHDNGYGQQVLVDGNGIVTTLWLQPITETSSIRTELWANRF